MTESQKSHPELAQQVEQLTQALEAARIERDQYKAATETMAQALSQMDLLLHPQQQSDSQTAEGL